VNTINLLLELGNPVQREERIEETLVKLAMWESEMFVYVRRGGAPL